MISDASPGPSHAPLRHGKHLNLSKVAFWPNGKWYHTEIF